MFSGQGSEIVPGQMTTSVSTDKLEKNIMSYSYITSWKFFGDMYRVNDENTAALVVNDSKKDHGSGLFSLLVTDGDTRAVMEHRRKEGRRWASFSIPLTFLAVFLFLSCVIIAQSINGASLESTQFATVVSGILSIIIGFMFAPVRIENLKGVLVEEHGTHDLHSVYDGLTTAEARAVIEAAGAGEDRTLAALLDRIEKRHRDISGRYHDHKTAVAEAAAERILSEAVAEVPEPVEPSVVPDDEAPTVVETPTAK